MSIFSWMWGAESQQTADCPQEQTTESFEGQLVSIGGRKLVVLDRRGMESSHALAKDARITCDGASCAPEDLKAGALIRVTTKQDGWKHVSCVEALDKQSEFTSCGDEC